MKDMNVDKKGILYNKNDNNNQKVNTMKAYRVCWHSWVEDGSVLEGRSLVYADSPEEAAGQVVLKKTKEYRLKPEWIRIESVVEIPSLQTDGQSEAAL
ncbi:hypothetical protein [Anoxybacillus sp. J5B_2022]|uniref:hypothetical protein n=1 Tax=Anoxybacillus sp. J5B_2022 TaxID=3003246 RepID=UPI0022866DFC|nr:hypothetical protein [Anoxybacillus sp. J5B_2022]MCZ0756808.1 hypothetical protein [Anoxybacillus sp. J5B_2022]